MSFNFSFVLGQAAAALALVLSAGAAAGCCMRVAKVYARLLTVGAQPDASCLGAALQAAARAYPHALWLAPRALARGRRRVLSVYLRNMPALLLPAFGLAITLHLYGPGPQGWVLAVAGIVLLLAAHIDARTGLLPDALTLPLLWMGLAAAWAGWGLVSLHDALAAAVAGYGALWLLVQGVRYWRGVEGMGRGDLKLLAAQGAWLGWQALAWVLLAASLAGIAFAMWRQKTCRPAGAYPFGPFLAAAGAGVYMAGTGVHLWFCG